MFQLSKLHSTKLTYIQMLQFIIHDIPEKCNQNFLIYWDSNLALHLNPNHAIMGSRGDGDMKKHGLSQEGLKLIACVAMLLDHIGAVFLPGIGLRIVGRIAFPIYCFLLAEGVHYTMNPKGYGLRLGMGVILSEVPFDLLLFGRLTIQYQSVMLTLLLGFFMAMCMKWVREVQLRVLLAVPFALMAEWLGTDYGGMGVILIGMFVLTREIPHRCWVQTVSMVVICYLMDSYRISVAEISIPIEMFALLSMISISLYSGRKVSNSRVIQWGFYLFYPVHLMVLWLITLVL